VIVICRDKNGENYIGDEKSSDGDQRWLVILMVAMTVIIMGERDDGGNIDSGGDSDANNGTNGGDLNPWPSFSLEKKRGSDNKMKLVRGAPLSENIFCPSRPSDFVLENIGLKKNKDNF
jgi:hypothetical protein